jgi:hypothetical protein
MNKKHRGKDFSFSPPTKEKIDIIFPRYRRAKKNWPPTSEDIEREKQRFLDKGGEIKKYKENGDFQPDKKQKAMQQEWGRTFGIYR